MSNVFCARCGRLASVRLGDDPLCGDCYLLDVTAEGAPGVERRRRTCAVCRKLIEGPYFVCSDCFRRLEPIL